MQPLPSLALLRFSGSDARSFLQGQLSNDLNSLTPVHSLLASCNSPQGRVQAILRLIELEDAIIAILPANLLDATASRLRKYQLRAKLHIDTATDALQISQANRTELTALGLPVPTMLGEHMQQGALSVLRWPDGQTERFLIMQPTDTRTDAPSEAADDAAWRLADIRAGLPQVAPETHESFVAQMLNLDLLDGISFNKGCYTGQEIIARAHFRGTVKRRMLRFHAHADAPAPGSRVLARGEPAGEVVLAANTAAGCELLAVISLSHLASPLSLADSGASLALLPLPYSVPTTNPAPQLA